MDLKAFSEENFEAVKWINEAFQGQPKGGNKEGIASNIVYKLQLFVQEINSSLEDTAQQVVHNLPKVTREADALREEANHLREEMVKIKDQLREVERESCHSMETLRGIDVVKNRMEETCKSLKEADNWANLSSDVEQVFGSGSVDSIASKLIGMQKSLEILVDVPDFEERVDRLEELKDRFEAILKGHVMAAFSSQTGDDVHVYVKLFKDLKRLPNLKRLYHEYYRNLLVMEWKRLVQVDAEESLIEWLNNFYDILLSTWLSQMSFCCNIMFSGDFETSVQVLADIFIDSISSLNPSLSVCINEALEARKSEPKKCLELLIETKIVVDRMVKSLEMNILNSGSVDKVKRKPQVLLLIQTIYSFFREALERYAALEEAVLLAEFNWIKSNYQPGESIGKMFAVAREAEKREHLISQSTKISTLINVLEVYFNHCLLHLKQSMDELKAKVKANGEGNETLSPDWPLLQLSLFNLQAVGDFSLQLQLLQEQLVSSTLSLARRLIVDNNTFRRVEELLLDDEDKLRLNVLMESAAEGDESQSAPVLVKILEESQVLCTLANQLVLEIALQHIRVHLRDLEERFLFHPQEEEMGEEVPSFSLSPQEYITQIGQYLLTIPQHIEPFVLQENAAFKLALKYTNSLEVPENLAEFLLDQIIRNAGDLFLAKILNISRLGVQQRMQLITDIEYLFDVLDDLGLTPGDQLQDLVVLLKASKDQFIALSEGKSDALVAAAAKLTL